LPRPARERAADTGVEGRSARARRHRRAVRPDTEPRKAGIEWVGRCPFHQERTASFYVNPGKGLYHCHGCDVGGDAIAYVRARHALDFMGAVEWLAERFNVPLEYEEESPEVAARRRGEDRRRELLALTAAFYQRVLRESPLAEGARTYLSDRGVAWDSASASAATRQTSMP
jgi:DNA primase